MTAGQRWEGRWERRGRVLVPATVSVTGEVLLFRDERPEDKKEGGVPWEGTTGLRLWRECQPSEMLVQMRILSLSG